MKIQRNTLKVICVLVLLDLSACGGGDGGPTSGAAGTATPVPIVQTVQAPTQIAAAAAWLNLVKIGGTWSLTGKANDGSALATSITITPGFDATIIRGGVTLGPYYTTTISTVSKVNGVAADSGSVKYYVDKTTNQVVGILDTSGICVEMQNSASVPQTAVINQSGPMFSGDVYPFASNQCNASTYTTKGKLSALWSYEVDGAVPLFCIALNRQPTSGVVSNTSNCFEIDASGSIKSRAKESGSSSTGATVLVKNY
jgi:hypothetical protein